MAQFTRTESSDSGLLHNCKIIIIGGLAVAELGLTAWLIDKHQQEIPRLWVVGFLLALACGTALFCGSPSTRNVIVVALHLAIGIPKIILWSVGATFIAHDLSQFPESLQSHVKAVEAIAWTLCAISVLRVLGFAFILIVLCTDWEKLESWVKRCRAVGGFGKISDNRVER